MTKTKKIGNFGERIICDYLFKKGFAVNEKNYHSRYGEIDLICRDGDNIAFVEVKTRGLKSLVSGLEAVDLRKRKKIVKTAYCYMQENNIEEQPRFDVAQVNVNVDKKVFKVTYIKNAFDLEGCDEFF